MQKLPLNVIKKCYDSDTARVRVSFFPQHLEEFAIADSKISSYDILGISLFLILKGESQ